MDFTMHFLGFDTVPTFFLQPTAHKTTLTTGPECLAHPKVEPGCIGRRIFKRQLVGKPRAISNSSGRRPIHAESCNRTQESVPGNLWDSKFVMRGKFPQFFYFLRHQDGELWLKPRLCDVQSSNQIVTVLTHFSKQTSLVVWEDHGTQRDDQNKADDSHGQAQNARLKETERLVAWCRAGI